MVFLHTPHIYAYICYTAIGCCAYALARRGGFGTGPYFSYFRQLLFALAFGVAQRAPQKPQRQERP